jgi:flagellin
LKLLNGNLKSAGNISVGTDSTTGSIVAKLTGGKLTSGTAVGVVGSGGVTISGGNFVEETLIVDGAEIKINWGTLTSEERSILTGATDSTTSKLQVTDLILRKINEAIDASGYGVAHVTGYFNSTNQFVIESGSTGINSKIALGTGASGVLSALMANGTSDNGQAVYNGSAISAGTTADLYVGDILMKVTFGAIGNGNAMTTVATAIETAINNAISSYNGVSGKTPGEEGFIENVKVLVTEDGRFQITSESGPVRLVDRTGQTAIKDLGLSDAQTEASSNGGVTFQIGANRGQTLSFGIGDMRTAALGLTSVDISTATNASKALDAIDKAIKTVSEQRSQMGAIQNRLEHTINNLQTASENLTAAESRIRDVDMAKEMMEFTKYNILSQAAQAMLAQANQQPQGVLQLLR